jgi:hypothetical protein
MKSFVLPLFALILATSTVIASDKGNGGFLYSRTSKKLLDTAQKSLLEELQARRIKALPNLYSSAVCSLPVDFARLEEKLRTLTFTYTDTSLGLNADGVEEPRFFDEKEGHIRATKDYFESFVESYFQYEEADQNQKDAILKRIRTPLIHEVIHDFGYDELKARLCAPELELILSTFNERKYTFLKLKITKDNDERILKFLEKFCPSSDPEMFANYSFDVGVMRAQSILSCATKNDKGLRKQNLTSSSNILQGISSFLDKPRTMEELARYLNSVLLFTFEDSGLIK